jgi:hypothetical protein
MLRIILTAAAVFLWLLVPAELFYWLIVLLPGLRAHSDLVSALLTVVGTISAAFIAWIAVMRQIRADEEARRLETVIDRAADADAIATLLFLGSSQLAKRAEGGLGSYIGPTCVQLLVNAMRADSRLGAALGGFIRDAEQLDGDSGARSVAGLQQRYFTLAAKVALRAHLLGKAFQVASRSLGSRGYVPNEPLLNPEDLKSSPGEASIDEDALGWVRLVLQPHEFP